MWKAILSCLFVYVGSAGCDQELEPQSDLQMTASAQQTPDESTTPDSNKFVGRDGIAEARDVIASGGPPKLYMHTFNGYAPGWATPGIAYCQPWTDDVVSFEAIPELAWSEGSAPNLPEPPNARAFATNFNKTMFEAYERQIKLVCPYAEMR